MRQVVQNIFAKHGRLNKRKWILHSPTERSGQSYSITVNHSVMRQTNLQPVTLSANADSTNGGVDAMDYVSGQVRRDCDIVSPHH